MKVREIINRCWLSRTFSIYVILPALLLETTRCDAKQDIALTDTPNTKESLPNTNTDFVIALPCTSLHYISLPTLRDRLVKIVPPPLLSSCTPWYPFSTVELTKPTHFIHERKLKTKHTIKNGALQWETP